VKHGGEYNNLGVAVQTYHRDGNYICSATQAVAWVENDSLIYTEGRSDLKFWDGCLRFLELYLKGKNILMLMKE
jgi:hypothetical protein